MNNKNISIIMTILLLAGLMACKKEDKSPTNNPTTTPVVKQPSKKALLNQVWILKDTYENGVQKTSNGTGRYEFNTYGNFRAELNGTFQDIGTYKFTTSDSNELSVKFNGTLTPYTWKLLKLDEKSLNTEFMAGTTKNNYNYTR